jgi:ParB-like chromosome segregation protein Spo0J
VGVRLTPLSDLRPGPWNPRTVGDKRFTNLCRAIAADPQFLWQRPVLAQADGAIYAGSLRYRAAQHFGLNAIPAIIEDVPDNLAKERALQDNLHAGDWERDDLAALLNQLRADSSDIDLLGFDDSELQRLLARLDAEAAPADPDDVPTLPDEPITQPGDLWLLGEHRLLCGDATDPDDVRRTMDGQFAACLWATTPRWGISLDGELAEHLIIENNEANGLSEFLSSAFQVADSVMRPGASFFVCHSDDLTYEVIGALRAVGWVQARPSMIVWLHDRLVLGDNDYDCRFQPIAHGWKAGDPHREVAGRRHTNVWEFALPAGSGAHPALKPVGLIARAIRNSSRSGDVIYDPFLRTGSTLIASEQLGRKCYGLERDPRYCDVIVRRWEQVTGKTATREQAQTGQRPAPASVSRGNQW